jgi:hypothetical protein
MLIPRGKHEIEDLGELGNRLNRFLLCPDMSIRSASFPLTDLSYNSLESTDPWLFVDFSRSSGSPSQLWIVEKNQDVVSSNMDI